jgi:glycosyltransferase involved in cell wall biosynthesis
VEACQARLPMVVTETCEIAEIINEKTARIVPVEIEAIAQGIIEVLNNPELQIRYKQGADELMRTTFSIQAVGDRLENLYEHVLLRERHAV